MLGLVPRLALTKHGTWLFSEVAARIDPWLMRCSTGRVNLAAGLLPVVLLTVRGARSGLERTVPLVYFADRDDVILIASSFGRPLSGLVPQHQGQSRGHAGGQGPAAPASLRVRPTERIARVFTSWPSSCTPDTATTRSGLLGYGTFRCCGWRRSRSRSPTPHA